jgi:hypothetical protein
VPPKEKLVTILVNNQPVELERGENTGLQIKEAAAVPADFTLYQRQGSHLNEIGDADTIKVHEHEEFIAVSGQDVS